MAPLQARLLTADAFAAFGQVIAEPPFDPADPKPNRRFDDLVDFQFDHAGAPMVSLLRMRLAAEAPYRLVKLERHPLGSQAFIPCTPVRFVVAVAPGGDRPDLDSLQVFVTDGRQGVNYRRGVWHAPVMVLEPASLIIVDRKGDGPNCDLFELPQPLEIRVG
jgi:ureidoglycolate lyase